MSEITRKELAGKIAVILKTADLKVLTSKSVRLQLEKDLGVSLLSRKKEIDELVMEGIDQKSDSEPASEEEAKEDSEEEAPRKKRAAAPAAKKAPAKKKRKRVNGTDTNSDSDNPSDEDYKQEKKPKKAKAAGSGPKKGTGFTRPYTLSPELSALMGAESLPRHEVVKKVWSIIKERNLYDPKNKQFAICDPELLKIMKVKRFRTFGMLKYLKPHFIN